jgi:hypothetical protein
VRVVRGAGVGTPIDRRDGMRLFLAVTLAALVGCQGFVNGSDDDVDYTATLPGGPCSTGDVTGTLPGVTISIVAPSCVYHRGQAATFEYEVIVDASAPAIDVPETGSCDCSSYSVQLASWTHWEIGGTSAGGENQRYCLCDTGCCAPQAAKTVTPEVGTSVREIEWSGRVWDGPSDTGNPQGDPFAVGMYAVSVDLYAFDRGRVTATLPIEVIP